MKVKEKMQTREQEVFQWRLKVDHKFSFTNIDWHLKNENKDKWMKRFFVHLTKEEEKDDDEEKKKIDEFVTLSQQEESRNCNCKPTDKVKCDRRNKSNWTFST